MSRALAPLVVVALAAISSGAGAVQIEASRPELCEYSERVVIAEVTDIETRWAADSKIERLIHVAVAGLATSVTTPIPPSIPPPTTFPAMG